MKNQNDLIISIVAAVVALGCAAAFFFGAPKPIELPAPAAVPTAPVAVAEGSVVYADSLPGGSSNGQPGAAGGAAAGGAAAAGAGPGRPSLGVAGGGGAPGRPSLGVAGGG